MIACPDKLLLLQAHVDGELDAANVLSLEAHLRSCTACAGQLARIEVVRAMLAGADLHHVAPVTLRTRIEGMAAAVPATKATPARAQGTVITLGRLFGALGAGARAIGSRWGGGLVTGLALCAALLLAMPQLTQRGTEDELIANHVRSLSLPTHLTDVATSDRHVVKPWFNGKIDFAPPVPELAAQGFPLVGGRLDYLDGREVAAIVYKRRLHTINLFVRPAGTLSLPLGIANRREGYSFVRWTGGGLEFWAVSDIDLSDLKLFCNTFTAQTSL
jgi:anti-sigma factor RsiW